MSAKVAVPSVHSRFTQKALPRAIAIALMVAGSAAAVAEPVDPNGGAGGDSSFGIRTARPGGDPGSTIGGVFGQAGSDGIATLDAASNAEPLGGKPYAGGGASGGMGGAAGSLGAGGGGGGGGATNVVSTNGYTGVATVYGGNGGNGGAGAADTVPHSFYSSGGGGGGGAAAVVVQGANGMVDLQSGSALIGGTGGNGGVGFLDTFAPVGGDGGMGLSVTGNNITVVVENGALVQGGAGGSGGLADSTPLWGIAGSGGHGGAGITMANGYITVSQTGAVVGGDGGAGGTYVDLPGKQTGLGGVGILGHDLDITIAGIVSGGLSGDGLIRADAVQLTGGVNKVTIEPTAQIAGNVVAAGTSTLQISSTTDQTLDASIFGDYDTAAQYQGFTNFAKIGAATLTLTGSTSYLTPWEVRSGTLSISSDAALGPVGGDLTLTNGTLKVTGNGFTTYRNVVLQSVGGVVQVEDPLGNFVVNGTVSGSGGLMKTGSGTLTLGGANTYTGGTQVAAGTLVGSTASVRGPVQVDATGMLQLVQDTDGTLSGYLAGTGTLVKDGTGRVTLSDDNSGFTGSTIISGGTLNVINNTLGGNVTVYPTATLMGDGTIAGNVSVFGNATLSPGKDKPGTLTIGGDLDLKTGSTLRIQSDSETQAVSRVVVGGAASLQGTVAVVEANGNYSTATSYNIVSAGHGITGGFTGVSSNLAFLQPTLTTQANDVVLTLARKEVTDPTSGGGATTPSGGGSTGGSRPMSFADAANSRNQRSVANALESLGSGNALYRQIENLADGQPQSVFKALSGESHASTASTLRTGADTARALPLEHFRSNLSANLLAGAPTAQAGTSDVGSNLSSLPSSSAKPIWAQVFGTWQTFGGGDAARVTQSTSGLFVGGDQAVGGGWRAGGALGYSETRSRAGEVSSKADIDNYSATLYGGRSFAAGPGKLNFLAGGSYTWHDIDSRRSIDTSGFNQSLKSNYGASTSQLFTELGYALPVTGALTLEPFAGVAWSDMRTRGFSESGGSAALNGEGDRNTLTTTTLGLRSRTTFALGKLEGTLRGTVGWRHAFGDVITHSRMSFNGSDSFTVAGVPQARDSALVEVAADVALSRNVSLGLAYGGEFGGGNTQNSGMLNLAWKF